MSDSKRTKLIREGDLIAEVEIEVMDESAAWGPFLSIETARTLDRVRAALKSGDTRAAAQLAKVYRLLPVTAA